MLQSFAIADLKATPWKNGGGTTREIASWPMGAGLEAFDWRVSLATIAASGPFSRFAGIDRTIMLVDGDGVQLQSEGFDHRMGEALRPFGFSGDVAVECTLLGGVSRDFNVMSRRTRCTADLEVITRAHKTPLADAGLLLALRGAWQAGDYRLDEGHGLWWADESLACSLEPLADCAAIVAVRWTATTTT